MKLTVLMSVFNNEEHLAEAIESIQEQSYKDFEFLIFNDASTDGSASILERYAKQDSRIKVVHNEANEGLGAALARGMEMARTDWVARMDADDIALPTRFETQVEFIRNNPGIDLFGTWIYDIDQNKEILSLRKFPTDHYNITRLIWTNPFKHSSVFLRRDAILKAGNYDPRLRKRQDYELWFRCCAAGLKMANIAKPLLKYRYTDAYFVKNNFRVSWSSALIGLRGCRLNRCPPHAYLGVFKPVFISVLPNFLRFRMYRFMYRFDPRHDTREAIPAESELKSLPAPAATSSRPALPAVLPKVSIVVVTRNEANNIERNLQGIFSQDLPFDKEVIIIDSESTDETRTIARNFPVTCIEIPKSQFHHGRTRNFGARIATGDYLVFLQGDAWPADPHWLAHLLDPLVKDDTVAACYGSQIPKDDCDPVNAFRYSWNYPSSPERKALTLFSSTSPSHRLYFFSTANCAVRRSIWETHPFPSDVPIFEDTTFAKLIIDEGHSVVYNPEAKVIHSHNLGPIDLYRRYRQLSQIQKYYQFTRHPTFKFSTEGLRYMHRGYFRILRESGFQWSLRFVLTCLSGYAGLIAGRFQPLKLDAKSSNS